MFDLDLFALFQGVAYQPYKVYAFVVMFMLASSFGLPFPEELTLISVGLVAHMAHHPEVYPPPFEGAIGVDTHVLAAVCFFAVLGSDTLVFLIGKFFGAKIIKTKFFEKTVGVERFNKINYWFQKYSVFASAIFRFTPGIRFPGHISCGLVGIPIWKFLMIDAVAAAISVPTQVYIVSHYGNVIIEKLKQFNKVVFVSAAIIILFYFGKKWLAYRKANKVS